MTTSFYDRGNDSWQVPNFSLPSEFIISGQGSELQSCAITIPEIIQRSLEDRFFSCLNFSRIRGAGTIEATLRPLVPSLLKLARAWLPQQVGSGSEGVITTEITQIRRKKSRWFHRVTHLLQFAPGWVT